MVSDFGLLISTTSFLSLSLELNDFKVRRVQMFRKNLIELTELQIKHSKVRVKMTECRSMHGFSFRLKFK